MVKSYIFSLEKHKLSDRTKKNLSAMQSKNDEVKPLIAIKKEPVRQERWYFGGLAGILAACCTHPLDTLKVQLQTQQRADYGLICKISFCFLFIQTN